MKAPAPGSAGRTLALAVLLLGAAALSSTVLAARGPTETVRAAVDEVLTILNDASIGSSARWEHIAPVINRHFDFPSMSQSVLATHWQSATPEEKRQFVDFFSQYLEETYRDKIEAYSSQEVRYTGERIRDDRAVVSTLIVTDTAEIPVDYKLRRSGERWLAYDVVIEHVSLVSNYRATFAAIAQSGGVQGVLADLQGRIESYKAARDAGQSQPSQ